jgi:ABC-2 type transport system permease protein
MPLHLWQALTRLGFRQQFAYPAATLWGLLTNTFFGALRVAVLLALFHAGSASGSSSLGSYTPERAITYVALTQVLLSAYSLFGWTDFMRTIHRGEIASDLLRPLGLLGFWASQDAGRAAAQLLLRGLPMLLIFSLIWSISWPPQPLLCVLSAVLAWGVGFLFRFLVNCAAFWSPDAVGFGRFAWAIMGLLCGFLMPLALFPAWFQAAAALTPFPAMLNTPIEIWLGVRTGPAAWQALGEQVVWLLLLYAGAQLALARGLRRLEVAGG